MADDLSVLREGMQSELRTSIERAASIVTKSYLGKLEQYKLVKPSVEDIDIDVAECGKFYRLTRLVVDRNELFLDKLTTIVNVVSSIGSSLAVILHSDGAQLDYYIGIISKRARGSDESSKRRREASAAAFSGALSGNLPGSDMRELPPQEINTLCGRLFETEGKGCAAISGIVSLREPDDRRIDNYIQGIENLVDSLKGHAYTVVTLADPVSASELESIKQGYELIHTQLSKFLRSSLTLSEGDTSSFSRARTEGVSEGITTGIAMTQSHTSGRGWSFGGNVGINAAPFGIGVSFGISGGINAFNSSSSGETSSNAQSHGTSRSETSSASGSTNTGRSLQLNYENRSVKALLDRIDRHLERLDACESYGAFNCAAYVVADSRESALSAASNYNALMRGRDSCVQAAHINAWSEPEAVRTIGRYLGALVHPKFRGDEGEVQVTPASIISGDELAIQIGLPKKSVVGVTVVPMTAFGRNPREPAGGKVTLGKLYHMGHTDSAADVSIDLDSLCSHTFVTGSTGSGKTNAVYMLLERVLDAGPGVSFMVIEPAKGEYKDKFGHRREVNVYGTNAEKTALLRLDPFSFPNDIHVLEHIDRLIEIFNVCWPMYAAMPAVLKDAVERAYIDAGWNLNTSACRYQSRDGIRLYPCFSDVLHQIEIVIAESKYSSESKGDYTGALCTRIKSLTNGIYGQIFTSNELSSAQLYDENVIVDLSRIGSTETKSLLMGMLVMKLQEYRMSQRTGSNARLQHLTVLEEAHHLLKRTSVEQSRDSSDLLGKSVELLANSIAEMRTYGEGFVIADQAPGSMDASVIRNTNTKLIFRLPDLSDRELAGRAAALTDDQILELSKLETGVAAVYQNNWLEPVLCRVQRCKSGESSYVYAPRTNTPQDQVVRELIDYLLLPLPEKLAQDTGKIKRLEQSVYRLWIPSGTKVRILQYFASNRVGEVQRLREQIIYGLFNTEEALEKCGAERYDIVAWCRDMLDALEPDIQGLDAAAREKILALIADEQLRQAPGPENTRLFVDLMGHIDAGKRGVQL